MITFVVLDEQFFFFSFFQSALANVKTKKKINFFWKKVKCFRDNFCVDFFVFCYGNRCILDHNKQKEENRNKTKVCIKNVAEPHREKRETRKMLLAFLRIFFWPNRKHRCEAVKKVVNDNNKPRKLYKSSQKNTLNTLSSVILVTYGTYIQIYCWHKKLLQQNMNKLF